MANPTNLRWTGPTAYVDGRPFGQADYAGYEVEVNAQPAIAIPSAWAPDNLYSFPVVDLPNLRQGTNAVRLRTVAANGQVSDWSNSVTFPYLSVPMAPTALVVE
jgi:hypothetical protein